MLRFASHMVAPAPKSENDGLDALGWFAAYNNGTPGVRRVALMPCSDAFGRPCAVHQKRASTMLNPGTAAAALGTSACIKFGSVFYLPPPCATNAGGNSSADAPTSLETSTTPSPATPLLRARLHNGRLHRRPSGGAASSTRVMSHSHRAFTDNFEAGPSDAWSSYVKAQWANLVRAKYLASADVGSTTAIHSCCIPRGAGRVGRRPPESACGTRTRRMPLEGWHIRHLWSQPYAQVAAPSAHAPSTAAATADEPAGGAPSSPASPAAFAAAPPSCWHDRAIKFAQSRLWSPGRCAPEEATSGACEEAEGLKEQGDWSKRIVQIDVGDLPPSPIPEAWAREHLHALNQLERLMAEEREEGP